MSKDLHAKVYGQMAKRMGSEKRGRFASTTHSLWGQTQCVTSQLLTKHNRDPAEGAVCAPGRWAARLQSWAFCYFTVGRMKNW